MDTKSMINEITNLRESKEFLDLLLDNIDTAVLIVDENFQIYRFNNSFENLFNKSHDDLEGKSFGQAIGCLNIVKENKPCGKTSQCMHCVLRQSLSKILTHGVSVNRKRLSQIFYIEGVPIQKYFEFSARLIQFHGRKMCLFILYDITEIEKQKIELQSKQSQIELDLQAAAAIQKSLLPHLTPNISSIQTAWGFEPCQQVGGDIFQLYAEDEQHITAYILDVCGHGVSAALIAVAASQFLQNLHDRTRERKSLLPPVTILKKLDREFPFDRFDCYFTIACATLDLKRGKLVYGCAGHVPPLIISADGEISILDYHGPVIGIGSELLFGQEEIKIKRGDKVILYTDGTIDNFGPKNGCHPKQRFYDALKELYDKPADQMVDHIMNISRRLRKGSEPDDDMSLLVIEYNG